MDCTSIPNFALLRHGTVILRIKMDVNSSCCQFSGRVTSAKGCSAVINKFSVCEQCTRFRLRNKFSDCDSDFVNKRRPHRTRTVEKRYVNVCAAVCLLLLVGGLAPQSAAAPHRTRRMADEENSLWGNPCDYNDSVIKSKPQNYTSNLAGKVASQASNTIKIAHTFKDDVARLHDYPTLEAMLEDWNSTHWLRNQGWETALPPQKKYGEEVDDDYLVDVMSNISEVLPHIGKSLKLLMAGLMKIGEYKELVDTNIPNNSLQRNFSNTANNVRAVLCYYYDVMRARHLEMLQLKDSEIPEFTYEDRITNAFLVYRDTINYLEYVKQVFKKMNETEV